MIDRLKNIRVNQTMVILFCTSLAFAGCIRNERNPGRVFVPDMRYSNAYETYASTSPLAPEKGDTMSARLPVEGTIPRGFIKTDKEEYIMSYVLTKHFKDPNYFPELNTEQYEKAGQMLKNPVAYSKEAMSEGKKMYTIYCAVCHGKKGEGNGPIIEPADGSDGPFLARPNPYETLLPTLTDGKMFYTMSFGKGMMGPYRSQLSAEERWTIIHYIKDLAGIAPGLVVEPEAGEDDDSDHDVAHEEDHDAEGEEHHEDEHDDDQGHNAEETH